MFLAAAKAKDQIVPVTGLAALGEHPVAFVRMEKQVVSPVRVLNL